MHPAADLRPQADAARVRSEAAEHIDGLSARLARSEELLSKATREYVVAKAEAAEAARGAAEARDQAAAEKRALQTERAAVAASGANQARGGGRRLEEEI